MQTYDREILTGNGKDWLGYQFCEARPEGGIVTAFSKTASARKNYACKLGDLVVPVDGSSCDSGRWMAFENDEYAIIPLKLFQD